MSSLSLDILSSRFSLPNRPKWKLVGTAATLGRRRRRGARFLTMPQILTTAEPVPPVLFLSSSRFPPLFSSSKLTPSRSRSSSFKIKPPCCQKMFVPGFGEASPEAKAATNLQNFFTFLAVKIVLAQLESYNPEAYEELMEFISRHSLNDGNKFCANLMRESPRHQTLALRILEVRSAYCKRDFEWDNLKRLAFKMVDESNTKLMRDYVLETSHVENEKS